MSELDVSRRKINGFYLKISLNESAKNDEVILKRVIETDGYINKVTGDVVKTNKHLYIDNIAIKFNRYNELKSILNDEELDNMFTASLVDAFKKVKKPSDLNVFEPNESIGFDFVIKNGNKDPIDWVEEYYSVSDIESLISDYSEYFTVELYKP